MQPNIKRFFSWLLSPVPDYVVESSDIHDMRTRDLQMLLKKISKGGVTNFEIDKILDKKELKSVIMKIMDDNKIAALNMLWRERAMKYTIIAGLITLFFFSSRWLMSIAVGFNKWVLGTCLFVLCLLFFHS